MSTTRAALSSSSSGYPSTLMIFDLLQLDGLDLCQLPLRQRHATLEDLDLDGPRDRSPHRLRRWPGYAGRQPQTRLEGMLAKRLRSPYVPSCAARTG